MYTVCRPNDCTNTKQDASLVCTRCPALLFFCVEVNESFRGSFYCFHGSFRGFHESFQCFHGSFQGSGGSFHESFIGTCANFHGKKIPEAFTEAISMEAFAKASMEIASMEVVEDAAEVTSTEAPTEVSTKASTKAFTGASTKAFTETSTNAFTEVLPQQLSRIRNVPRKHFHGFSGFSFMQASDSSHGRSEAQRLPRKL